MSCALFENYDYGAWFFSYSLFLIPSLKNIVSSLLPCKHPQTFYFFIITMKKFIRVRLKTESAISGISTQIRDNMPPLPETINFDFFANIVDVNAFVEEKMSGFVKQRIFQR